MKNETAFSRELKLIIQSVGGIYFKIHGHAMQESGWPDSYISHPFWRGWVELKNGDRKVTKLQQEKMSRLINCKDQVLALRFKDGIITAEWKWEVIGTFSEDAWKQKMGQTRAWRLFDFLRLNSARINREEGN